MLLLLVALAFFLFSPTLLKEQEIWSRRCKVTHGGLEYGGSVFVTQTGRHCKFWDAGHGEVNISDRDFPDGSRRKARNFCRNPTGAPEGPWCFTTDPTVAEDVCDVPLCRLAECRHTGPGVEFAGPYKLEDCFRWNDDDAFPGGRRFPSSRFPEQSRSDAGRSCRNPDGDEGGPWCMLEGHQRGYCHIPFCEEQECLTYSSASAEAPGHFIRLGESVNNVTFAVKLWDPAAWRTAQVRIGLSRTVHLETDSVTLLISRDRSGFVSGIEDPHVWEDTEKLALTGVGWTTYWMAWEEGYISVGRGDSPEPLTTDQLPDKKHEEFVFYSVSGAGVLWVPPGCGDCVEHVTTGNHFSQFREMASSGGGHETRVFVRAVQTACVELRTSPSLAVPRFRITVGHDNTTVVTLKVDASEPSVVLKKQRVVGALDYWRWHEFSISVVGDALLVLWLRDVGALTVAQLQHPLLAHVRWFSVGSRLSTARWTLACALPQPPPPSPPECVLAPAASRGYSGTQWVSKHGLACLPWTHQVALGAGLSASDLNYCRNPDSNPVGPWCYVVGAAGNVFKERCDVRLCTNLECRMAGTGNDYMGKMNTTRSNRTCQSWLSTSPHHIPREYLNASLFPERSLEEASNYCRDPSRNVAGPWCFTVDPRVPQDLCPVYDCAMPEACIVMTRGSSEGRDVVVQPRWRTRGLLFSLKEWDPDLNDTIVWHVRPSAGPKALRLEVGAEGNEKVKLFLIHGGHELLLKEKLLSHLIPIGKWGNFWLKMAAGELRLGYQGAEEAIFEWRKSPAPFYPVYVGYTSLVGHTIGVKFPCSDCHTELTSTRQLTKILPVQLWRQAPPTSRLTLHVRGTGAAQVPLMLLPGHGDYHAVTLGEEGDRIYWLRQRERQVTVLKVVRLPFPVLSNHSWTRFTFVWTEHTMKIYREKTLFVKEQSDYPLLFYFFTVAAQEGEVMWVANCDPPEVDAPAVDGGWSEWRPSQCSASCGGGFGVKTRTCTRPRPTIFGRDCEGNSTLEEACNTFPCGLLSPDTEELLREEVARRFFALEVAAGSNVSLDCGDALMMNRVSREAPEARLRWTKDGRTLAANTSLLAVVGRAGASGVYTCSLLHGAATPTLLLRVTSVAVLTPVTVRATTALPLHCRSLVLGYLYQQLDIRWELDGAVWRDYGVTLPAAVDRSSVENVNSSHQGTWRCVVEQRELGFRWVTNWMRVTVKPAPTFLTHLMEDPLPAILFGRFTTEIQVLVVLVCSTLSFVLLVILVTVGYLRYCRLP